MPALPLAQLSQLYSDGDASRAGLFALRNVTTADTIDVANWFSKVTFAAFISQTNTVSGLPAVAGTVLTFGMAGLTKDAGLLLVLGGAA